MIIYDDLYILQLERGEIISQLKPLDAENKQLNIMVEEKRKEMEPLRQALGKLRTADSAGHGNGLCSSEEELNEAVRFLSPSLFMDYLDTHTFKPLMHVL